VRLRPPLINVSQALIEFRCAGGKTVGALAGKYCLIFLAHFTPRVAGTTTTRQKHRQTNNGHSLFPVFETSRHHAVENSDKLSHKAVHYILSGGAAIADFEANTLFRPRLVIEI